MTEVNEYCSFILTAINNEEGNNDDTQVQHANEIEPESKSDTASKVAAPCWSVDILHYKIALNSKKKNQHSLERVY